MAEPTWFGRVARNAVTNGTAASGRPSSNSALARRKPDTPYGSCATSGARISRAVYQSLTATACLAASSRSALPLLMP